MSWYNEIPGLTPVSYFKSSSANSIEIQDIIGSKFLNSKIGNDYSYFYPVVIDGFVLSLIPYNYLKLSETIHLPEESTVCISFLLEEFSPKYYYLIYSEGDSHRFGLFHYQSRTNVSIRNNNSRDEKFLSNGNLHGKVTLSYIKSPDKSWMYANGSIAEMTNNIRMPNISAISRNTPNTYSVWGDDVFFGSLIVFNGTASDPSTLDLISTKMWEDLRSSPKALDLPNDSMVDSGYKYSTSISVQFHEGISPESFYYRGSGTIRGRVLVNEKGKKIPYSGKVALIEETTRKHLGDTISDSDGNFEFKNVNPTLKYSTIAYDETGEHVAVADFVNVEVN